jgi:glycosyltransferase involved in cell wall biosynthesis
MNAINALEILGDPTGGIRKHVHEIIESTIDDVNFNISYAHGLSFDSHGSIDLIFFKLKNINTLLLEITKKPSYSDILNICKICIFVYRNNINIIHGHGAKGGLYARIVGFFLNIPSFYTPHGGSIHQVFPPIEGFIYRTIERILKPLTSFFLFESYYSYSAYISCCGSIGGNKYLINPNGINETCLPIRSDISLVNFSKDYINLLVVGVLRKIKGQLIAIKALEILNSHGNKYRLHFCGSGPDLDFLKNTVRELNLSNSVFFYGEVSNISDYYSLSDIVIIPSFFESFGYVALESAIMRRPVIASSAGGLPEIVLDGNTGLLFEPGNYRSLAGKIKLLSADIILKNSLVDNSYFRALENFNSKKMLQNIKNSYLSFFN